MVQRGEGAGRRRVRLAAVGRQHSGDVAGTGVERRRGPRGGGQGAVQRLQQGHGLVARRDVLRRLQTTGSHAGHSGRKLLLFYMNSAYFCFLPLTECSSESDVCEVMTGLKLVGEMGLSFFLMARICSRARKAKRQDAAVVSAAASQQ